MKKLLSLLLLLNMIFVYSQQKYEVLFQNELVQVEENINTFNWEELSEQSMWKNGYYAYIQFYNTPSQTIQDGLKTDGTLLIEYISKGTYLCYFSKKMSILHLKKMGIRAIFPIKNIYKIALNLQERPLADWAVDGDKIKVIIQFYDNIPRDYVISALQKKSIKIDKQNEYSSLLTVTIPIAEIEDIASLVFVKWMEQIPPPPQPDDTRGRSLHRMNAINTNYVGGRNYTGVGVGVMVRDDGIVGPHIDFQGRINNSRASGTGRNHGDGVAGILAGAGNIDPYMKGMASGSPVYIVNYESDFNDNATNTYINDGSVLITNSSYSNGCNHGYTTITQTVDTQINNNLSLLHVFSAGNSNGHDCGYGAGNQWGNITGGHKQGKNVIATANLTYNGILANTSSRGPASDGRIKPDIAANGRGHQSTDENNSYRVFGGTSGASPGIAGISAVLYEAYKTHNAGATPESALIKATLLNTANDLGNPGPDFKYGWGHVNALRAAMLIEDHRFLSDNISQGETKNHNINIPAGTKEVRFMVYWNDPAAAPGNSKALINDLDMSVSDPSGTNHLPWILDHTPNPINLNLPAIHGVDHLNNMEQVLIQNPVQGNYNINISGYDIPMGPQHYFVVYEIITEGITVTYPIGGESLTVGDIEVIHWDAHGTADDFTLEYSIDNGTTWNNIATVTSDKRLYEWTVPNNISGHCLFKLSSGSMNDTSDAEFSIANKVRNVLLTQVCPNQAKIVCDQIAGATAYEVYFLGNKYMELVASSSSNNITIPIANSNDSFWYAVRAKKDNDWTTERTIAKFHPGGLLNCSLNDDLALTSIENPTEGYICSANNIVSVKIQNTGLNNQQNFTVSYQLNNETAVQETYTNILLSGNETTFSFTQPISMVVGTNNTLRAWVTLTGDENTNNNEQTVNSYYFSNLAPFIDDVEAHAGTTSSEIGNCWSSIPSGVTNAYRWNVIGNGGSTPTSGTGPNSAHSGNNYFFTEASSPAQQGNIAELLTPVIDVSALTTPQLSFYYHMYGSGMGSLHVDVSDNGTWHNDEIVISGQQQTSGSDAWLEYSLVLGAYSGDVQVRFRGIRGNDYHGDISIDDIKIIEAPTCPVPSNLTVSNISFETADVSWTAGNVETHWQVEYGLQGFTHGNGTLVDVSTNSLSLIGLTQSTAYDVYVKANCGASPGDDDSAWLGPITFNTNTDYCSGGMFYDTGGANGDYGNNENITTIIAPAAGYDRVKVVFNSFSTESGYDKLYVYDGPDENAASLGVFSGTSIPGPFVSTHATGSLAFKFISDSSATRSGWEAAVTCETLAIENVFIEGFKYYPNPTNTIINVSASKQIQCVYIFDTLGREIRRFIPKSNKFSVDTSGLKSGVYFMQVEVNGVQKTVEIIKE